MIGCALGHLFVDQLVIKSKNNHKNCMHGIRNSKDNDVVEGQQGVEKNPVQTSNAQTECSTVVCVELETVTFLNIDEVQPNSVQLSHIPQLFQI